MLSALIKKELLALTRDFHGLAALFVMPVMFIIVMSLALQDLYSPPQRTLHYAISTRDHGALAQNFASSWQREHGPAQSIPHWREALRAGQLSYVLVLQDGLSDALAQPALPTVARIELLIEPGADVNLHNELRAEVSSAAGELKARTALVNAGLPPPPADASMQALVHVERFAGGTIDASDHSRNRSDERSGRGPRPSAVQQNVPAWLVFGMFFVVASLANLLVQERSTGALARLQSLGVSRVVLLASKALPYIGVNAMQAVLMLAVGIWVMPFIGGDALSLTGISWGGLLGALLAVSCAAVSMALALACAVRTHAQATAVGPIINMLLAAIGGIMVPKFAMPAFMQRLAELSPMNWGLEALLSVLLRGGGIASTMPQVLYLGGFAALMFGVALLLFQRPLK